MTPAFLRVLCLVKAQFGILATVQIRCRVVDTDFRLWIDGSEPYHALS